MNELKIVEIGNIGKDKEVLFSIPNYQRGYRWGKQEVEYLLNDIWESCEKIGKENTSNNQDSAEIAQILAISKIIKINFIACNRWL